ncbi:pyridoxamine 5'-phosphate oxidase family protein [Streptomyces sp. NPDC094038]|uniref:pyridoxamine 5'-phosphate oxidase family protein n=1 Tax=Streptomyces sp. NPDC094038 TaxID=3366055 RepID=UPI0038054BAD
MNVLGFTPPGVLRAYRTCEFVTLGRDGTPLVWPTTVWRREDGTLLVTTSLAFAQKALNVRRDSRVALLFSDPTGSGLDHAPQIYVGGRADCPDTVMTGPEGAEDYWRMLFERQPHSRSYLSAPMRRLTEWYYLRLLITVTPEQVAVRAPLATGPQCRVTADSPLVGAAQLAGFRTAVLAARDRSGAPVLARTRPVPTADGFAVEVPSDCAAKPGPASLLVHRHDWRLHGLQNALVRGELHTVDEGWLLVPEKVVQPMGSGRPSDAIQLLRHAEHATNRYLERRGLERPHVRWEEFKALAATAERV